MANYNKPKKGFKKGNKLGKGQPIIPPKVKQMRKDNILRYTEIITEMSKLSISKLEEIVRDKSQNIIRAYVASSMLKSYAKGEPHRFEMLADRALGKVPDKLRVTEDKPPDINLVFVGNKKINK